MQGDVVAIYNESGAKVASYVYDAWGNFTTTYHNGGASLTPVIKNPLLYRGYYYDRDLGMYYLQTRYYDSNIGRFLNADSVISGTNGSLKGYNLYAYCFNNPVSLTDGTGNWPWLNNIVDAFFSSFEIKLGIGFGIGFDFCSIVSAEISKNTYVGVDDSVGITGNEITLKASYLDMGAGIEIDHLSEKGGVRVSESSNAMDGPLDMIFYPESTTKISMESKRFSLNSEGEFLRKADFSAYLGVGFSASFGFNITELFVRLFN